MRQTNEGEEIDRVREGLLEAPKEKYGEKSDGGSTRVCACVAAAAAALAALVMVALARQGVLNLNLLEVPR